MDRLDSRSRRRVLRLGAVTASTALIAGCGGPGEGDDDPDAEEGTGNGQDRDDDPDEDDDGDLATEDEADDDADLEDDEDPDEEDPGDEDDDSEDVDGAESWDEVEEILLATSEDQVWVGEEPSLIEGEENPTLELLAGEEYEIGYVNEDGEGHNLSIWADDDDREATDVNNEAGEEHWLTVEAEDDLTAYRCEVHPDSMVGEIEIDDE